MSESRHTPGPWWIQQDKRGVARYWVRGDGHEQVFVASVGNGTDGKQSHERSLANARLIAAAPELLEALQYLCDVSHTDPRGWDQARAAIAKATGGAS